MKKMGNTKFIMMVLVIMMLGLVYYNYLNSNKKNEITASEASEKEQLLNYDFTKEYPKTVRETVKTHCRYLKTAYNGVFTEDELFIANRQIRQLFDEELLENNTQEAQMKGFQEEVALYKENKQKIIRFILAESSQIQYNTEDDVEYAKMKVTLVIKAGTTTVSADEEYILRKDADENWKILGWQAVKKKDSEDKGDTK